MMKFAKTVFVTILFFISGILGTIYLLTLYFWEKRGISLNIALSFSAASSLLCLPLPRNLRQTKHVLSQLCCRFFFLYTPLESSTGWPEQLKRRIFTKKNILLQTSGTLLSLKAPKHDCP